MCTSDFSHLRGEGAGYVSTTPVHYGQRTAVGIINFQAFLAWPMCRLSGLPQSEKPTVSEWQAFQGAIFSVER